MYGAPSHRRKGGSLGASVMALGRLKPGTMNKTERSYSYHLEALKAAGEVLWYKFEGIKLRLADNTFLTVDFAVLSADGYLEMHDVKGSKGMFLDDARAKMKIAADMFAFKFCAVYPSKAHGSGGWERESF